VGTATVNYKGSNYTVIGTWTDPYTDLRVSKVAERFPDWVELNRATNEVGKLALVIGRGTRRGSEIYGTCLGNVPAVYSYSTNIIPPVFGFVTNYTFSTNWVSATATNTRVVLVTNRYPCLETNIFLEPPQTTVTNISRRTATNYLEVKTWRPIYKADAVRWFTNRQPVIATAWVTNVLQKTNAGGWVTSIVERTCTTINVQTQRVYSTELTAMVTTNGSVVTRMTSPAQKVISSNLVSAATWVTNTHMAGWNWGAGAGVKRWGTNQVDSAQNGYIWFQFLPGTCTVSSGDSSGMVFVNDNGTAKLVGVIYAVGWTTWAMFDGRGVNGMSCSGPPVTSGFVSSRIADRIEWIEAVVSGR
jgi:hypothetical protein